MSEAAQVAPRRREAVLTQVLTQVLPQDMQLCSEVLRQHREDHRRQLLGPLGTRAMASSGPSSPDFGDLAA